MVKRRSAAMAAALSLALALAASFPALAASSPPTQEEATIEADADAADVVVLLDLSQSALPYFQDVTDYVVTSVVEDYLRYGDTFHLLSFGETAQVEIAQRMSGEADVKSVLGRLYLLYPLAGHSDLVGALSYLYQYVADLPESRRKVVVVITDGMHNPPPGSPTYGMPPDKVAAEIDAACGRIRSNGWPVHVIKLPFPKPGEPGAPASGSDESKGVSYIDQAAKALGADVAQFSSARKEDIARESLALPIAEFPGPLGKKDYAFSFPLKIRNDAGNALTLELDRVRLDGSDILDHTTFLKLPSGKSGTMDVPVLLPDSIAEGPARLEVKLHFANGIRVGPDTGTLDLTIARNPIAAMLRTGFRAILLAVITLLGLAAILAFILVLRRMPKRAEAPIAAAVLEGETGSTSTAASPAASKRVAAKEAAQQARASSGAAEQAATTSTAARRAAIDKAQAELASTAGAKGIKASERERENNAAAEAAAFAAAKRAEAAQAAAALAAAASASSAAASSSPSAAGRSAPAQAAAPTGASEPTAAKRAGRRLGALSFRKADAHEDAIAREAEAMAERRRAEAKRDAELLAQAARKPAPATVSGRSREAVSSYKAKVVKPGSIEVELFVEDQNPHIGTRNVRSLSAGSGKSVGGGTSDFLIFLVKMPRRIAELHFDGEKLIFVPLRLELFPELKGPVEDCLGKDIPMISKEGYPLKLRFAAYEKPADKINKLLHCIETPGL